MHLKVCSSLSGATFWVLSEHYFLILRLKALLRTSIMSTKRKDKPSSTQTILLAGGAALAKGKTFLEAGGKHRQQIKSFLRRPLPLPLALLIFAGASVLVLLVNGVFSAVGNYVPRLIRPIRDLLMVASMLLLMVSIAASPFIEKRNIKKALLNVFWGIVAAIILLGLANLINTEELMSALVALVTLALWPQMRSLIFYKSKRNTARNFRLLAMAGAIYLGYRIVFDVDTNIFSGDDYAGKALSFALIFLMVINGARHEWIRHLSGKQKRTAFFLGAITVALSIATLNEISQGSYVEHSIALYNFISASFLFFAVYSGMALLALLMQLPTAGLFDEKMREIQTLRELSSSIISELDINNLVRTITEKAMQASKADAVWLKLLDEKSGKLTLTSAINLTAEENANLSLDRQHGVTGWILKNRRPILVNEIEADERTAYLKKWKSDIAALIGVPLLSKGRPLGVLFSTKSDPWSFDQFDRDMLQAFANQAAVAIDNANLWLESIERERLAQTLQIAHDAQMKLLPKRMPVLPHVDVAALAVTANEVGGDYFDFFEYPGRLGVVIGDVSGKGAAAAFHMAEMKGIIEAYSRIYHSPREVLMHANAALYRSIESTAFVSLIYAHIDYERQEMLYSRAGHCPIIFVRANERPRILQPDGIALGLDIGELFDKVITEDRLQLQKDDVLIFYTDGVTEAMDENSREFEESRLVELAGRLEGKTSQEILQAIEDAVRSFVGPAKSHDDYTVVVLKMK